jgi:SAM-dependent methyltransferase
MTLRLDLPHRRSRALDRHLDELYRREVETDGGREYLRVHATHSSIARQVDVVERYLRSIPSGAKVLDWGCHHAPDSCLLRDALGDDVTLHGCDFDPPGRYPAFHGFARLAYRQLNHPITLPYEPETFDAVISSGVLEHAAMDYESPNELHRVLKENGTLVITFLPNRLSFSEWAARQRGMNAHRRLYGLGKAVRMLLHHGFYPRVARYHQFIPAHHYQTALGRLWPVNDALERLWPLKLFCANIMIVAEKRLIM